ncbi:collagenase [Streptomyces sp. XD-27]|uniref:collagenase n=1 Tax=Streptomyces sp. XD-27 TaxID=3062779 RepID=UPI0026F454E4|nr:collagenase [Streptomyces sp. XD-27]WKX70761.1 collagenase [Streptomyces sp. XD-27]
MRLPSARKKARSLAALALALGVSGGLIAAQGHATPPKDSGRPGTPISAGPSADGPGPLAQLGAVPDAGGHGHDHGHVDARAPKPADRPPLTVSNDAQRVDYNLHSKPTPRKRPSMRQQKSARAAAAECNVSDFTSNTGSALVEKIKGATTECINTLFSLTGSDARGAFREEQMVTVADALREGSASYPGDGSTGMPQIVLFLRAGYYVAWNHQDDVGEYGPELRSAIQGGLDAFFESEHSHDVTDANGETLAEAVTLIDSASENARYLPIVKRMLEGYDSSYDSSYWMVTAVNNAYSVLFRGHQMPEFVTAVEGDPTVLTTLSDFALNHLDLLGGKQSYLASNAGRELARFLRHDSLRDKVRPMAKELLGKSSITGRTAPLWVGIAEMTEEYDKDNCEDYGTCNLKERLIKEVLPVQHDCGDGITVRAQEITGAQLDEACDSLKNQNEFFHNIARDSGPVEGDLNDTIEVTAFDSSTDYKTYAGIIYGIDTNNGGMYLEGDPTAEDNQPRFIAYEAEWLKPKFAIWNLNHEYTHYLDGRFDMYGDFEAGVTTPTVWWIEGFAEYVSYTYRKENYDKAIEEAGKHTYKLSELWNTTYENSNTTRTYQWGYLAVRFMLEKHRSEVDTVLGSYRTGDWEGARRYLTESIGDRYDSEFDSWLTECAEGACKAA